MQTRKKLTLLLFLVVVMSMLLAIPAFAKPKPKLDQKSVSINVGQSVKLNLINAKKAKWTSSNKKVATVKNGLVVGKKAGKAVISAKVGKKTLKCKVNVLPIPAVQTYVCNTNTMKFHRPDCRSVGEILPKNRFDTTESREAIIAKGFVPCKICCP